MKQKPKFVIYKNEVKVIRGLNIFTIAKGTRAQIEKWIAKDSVEVFVRTMSGHYLRISEIFIGSRNQDCIFHQKPFQSVYSVIDRTNKGLYKYFTINHILLGGHVWTIWDEGIESWEVGQLMGGN